ncbi:glycosyltransferase family 39 protein [Paenibacillus sp. FSL F4-0243]|uniref:glycosyltransferase family 39 protein n=1 Tax=Paenibacillus sp. FSL F4-0243 TaxID=2954732 RepID=UPI0030D8EA5C
MVTEKIRDLKNIYVLLAIFLVNFIVRLYLAIKFVIPDTFYDEVLWYNLGGSINKSFEMIFRGFNMDIKTILYSMFIAPAFNLPNNYQYVGVISINVFLMSLTVFFIYKIIITITSSRKIAYFGVILNCLMPEMAYSSKILQDNLFYPLTLLTLLVLIRLIKSDKNKLATSILLGFLVFLLTICKDFGLALLVSLVIFFVWDIFSSKNVKKSLVTLGSFGCTFVVFNYAYTKWFYFVNNDINNDFASSSLVHVLLQKLFDIEELIRYFYAINIYLLLLLLCTGIIPIILIILNFRKLTDYQQKFALIVLTTCFITLSVAIFLTIGSETPNDTSIRVHFRYIYSYFVILITLGLYSWEIGLNSDQYKKLINVLYITSAFIIIATLRINPGSSIDSPIIISFRYFDRYAYGEYLIKSFFLFIIILMLYAIRKNKKLISIGLFVGILSSFILNTIIWYDWQNDNKIVQESLIQDITAINHIVGNKDVLLIGQTVASESNLEMNLQDTDYRYMLFDDFVNKLEDEGEFSIKDIRLSGFQINEQVDLTNYPQYIITRINTLQNIEIDGYKKMDTNLAQYDIYNLESMDMNLQYLINNRYSDNWTEKNFSIETYGLRGKDKFNLYLNISKGSNPNRVIDMKFSTEQGNNQIKIDKENSEVYKVELKKDINEDKVVVNVSSENSFIPNNVLMNGDSRELLIQLESLEVE